MLMLLSWGQEWVGPQRLRSSLKLACALCV